ncbi:MAG: YhdH/YhfP family quinone oxidoreductase [Pseudomonadota bacterium]|nr:YhdH/YhfP family quinone oxidoreductase [Pseudomonadota bacterium]
MRRKALLITGEGAPSLQTLPVPTPNRGEVLVRVKYSSLNYKDALALTGKGKIIRQFPCIAGIDLAGEVLASNGTAWQQGQRVVATGCGLGETVDGGYCEIACVASDHLVALPAELQLQDAMRLGTAGFTAALCLQRLEQNGQHPELGLVAITGASGGVGMLATSMFARSKYDVLALTSKENSYPQLLALGAKQVAAPDILLLPDAPLHSTRYGGAVDNLGGKYLVSLLKSVKLWGNVASVGLAAAAQFESNVFPHILRGVSLLGISSNNCPMSLRRQLWQRLATDLKPPQLAAISTTISLDELPSKAKQMFQRQTTGRIVVSI